jgi:hypothetical protein
LFSLEQARRPPKTNPVVNNGLALARLYGDAQTPDFGQAWGAACPGKLRFVVLAQADQILIKETAQIRLIFWISSHCRSGSAHENANCLDRLMPEERTAEVDKTYRCIRAPNPAQDSQKPGAQFPLRHPAHVGERRPPPNFEQCLIDNFTLLREDRAPHRLRESHRFHAPYLCKPSAIANAGFATHRDRGLRDLAQGVREFPQVGTPEYALFLRFQALP